MMMIMMMIAKLLCAGAVKNRMSLINRRPVVIVAKPAPELAVVEVAMTAMAVEAVTGAQTVVVIMILAVNYAGIFSGDSSSRIIGNHYFLVSHFPSLSLSLSFLH